jgi:pseudaminic acid biosynthesis-associated methylase
MKSRPIVNRQIDVWSGEFGKAYTGRNSFADADAFNAFYIERFGVSRDELNRRQLGSLPRDVRIVEVGCNIGNQLAALRRLGFEHLYGVELQRSAVEIVHRERPELDVVQGSALELPFRDGFADLVFTSNVLIHMAPENLPKVMDEMHRVSRRYIWGFEYFAPSLVEVPYRGHDQLLWKADYGQMFLDRFSDLALVSWQSFPYRDQPELVDKLYLLEKRS